VQTHFTQFGRVELDPSRIPAVTHSRARQDEFARELETALHTPNEAAAPARAPQTVAVEESAGAEEPQVAPDQSAAPAPTAELTPRHAQPGIVAGADLRPRPDLAATAAPDLSGSTRTAPPGVSEVLAPHRAPQVAAPIADGPVFTPARAVPAPIAPATLAAAATPARAAAGSTTMSSDARPARVALASPAAGYRSLDPLALARLEAARDSVLKQIAFTLRDGTSEARIQLEPPELGGLDVELLVDAAGQTRLALIAERPEVAALLTQHMPALASTLAHQGLTIAHADVKSRDGKPRQDTWATAPARSVGADEQVSRARAPITFFTSTGLDLLA
jgi:hypothetical protein